MMTTPRRALLAAVLAVLVFNLVMVALVLLADAGPQTCDDTRPGTAAACVADGGAQAQFLLLLVGDLVLAAAAALVTGRRRRSR